MGAVKKSIENERCVYCSRPAVTIEHCPPRVLFVNKDRPKGWEFSACRPCNEGTRDSDQIFAFFVYANILQFSNTEWRHFWKVARGVNNNQQHIIDELLLNATPLALGSVLQPPARGPVTVTMGRGLQSHVNRVADKLVLSAHFVEFGTRAPDNALVWHQWITNMDVIEGRLPRLDFPFEPLRAIEQGKKTTKGQFSYQIARGSIGNAVFRFVFQNRVLLLSLIATPEEKDRPRATAEGFRSPCTLNPSPPSVISFADPNQIIRPLYGRPRS